MVWLEAAGALVVELGAAALSVGALQAAMSPALNIAGVSNSRSRGCPERFSDGVSKSTKPSPSHRIRTQTRC
jgi:hypothetical protein